MKGTLYIMCGLPGAGKSTFVEEFLSDCHIISMDEIRRINFGSRADQSHNQEVYKLAISDLVQTANNFDFNIVWDATSYTKKQRKFILKYKDYFDKVVCVYITTNHIECLYRQHNRPDEEKVPVEVILRMNSNFEEPTLDEGFDKIIKIETKEREQ